ncbi:hypothetical protein NVP1138O_31 [Vibrio phage 1.138.O._10N.261.48.A1]|nr:hypothetical protein NVP1138O_31 [Vibrio phage 1.138.O._10N.261.48.A1]
MKYEDLTEFQKKYWRVENGFCHWCRNSQMMQGTAFGAITIDCPKCGANPEKRQPASVTHDDK